MPVWLLLPYVPDWRWQLDREDSPWYPSVKLWRQYRHGDWSGVLTDLGRALAELAAGTYPESVEMALEAGRQALVAGKPEQAGQLFWPALRAAPSHARLNHALAVWAYQSGHLDLAVLMGERASRLAPEDAEIRANLGAYHKALGDLAEARHQLLAAVRLAPKHAGAQSNLGNVYAAQGRWEDALKWAQKALKLNPESADFHYNLGIALKENGRYGEALKAFRQAQALSPSGHVKAALHQALVELLTGDFTRGWGDYESRWLQPDCKEIRHFAQPQWLGGGEVGNAMGNAGGNLAGKRVLVHAEQGFGDSFQFLRYVPMLAAAGARVILVVQPEIMSLAARLQGDIQCVPSGSPLPDFDLHCPLLSLPRAFATTLDSIPASVPYLHADPDRVAYWQSRLGPARGYRVGLVWAGRPTHGNDANRSMQLAQFDALLNLEGVEVVSLQKGPAEAQLATAPGPILPLGAELASFEDTAAVLTLLDALVSVDTSVAHLAGALGRPAHVLLPAVPDWRWLLERRDSPWYPGMVLYRQPTRGDWRTPLGQLLFDLQSAAAR